MKITSQGGKIDFVIDHIAKNLREELSKLN